MQNKTTEILTAKKFAEIYKNEELRNQVAGAHQYCKSGGEFVHMQTCSYPVTYIVTEQQIAEAEKEWVRAKKQTIKDNEGKLMFVGMGMTYQPRYEDDICNHRIRVEFQNPAGRRFFVEFGTMHEDQTHCDFSIDRTRQDELKDDINKQSQFFNYKGLERNMCLGKYTKQNILRIVNKYFDCNFKEIVIDNYNVSPDDYASVSPSN